MLAFGPVEEACPPEIVQNASAEQTTIADAAVRLFGHVAGSGLLPSADGREADGFDPDQNGEDQHESGQGGQWG